MPANFYLNFKDQLVAIKENIDYIKDNLSSEEQFLQGAIRSEQFLRRHKKLFIIASIALIVVLGAWAATTAIQTYNKNNANAAYNALLADSGDTSAKQNLIAKSPSLFALFALQSKDQNLIKEALSLPIDPLLKSVLELAQSNGSSSGDGLLVGYSALMAGYKLLQSDPAAARAEFSKIPATSPLAPIAQSLAHYQGK